MRGHIRGRRKENTEKGGEIVKEEEKRKEQNRTEMVHERLMIIYLTYVEEK